MIELDTTVRVAVACVLLILLIVLIWRSAPRAGFQAGVDTAVDPAGQGRFRGGTDVIDYSPPALPAAPVSSYDFRPGTDTSPPSWLWSYPGANAGLPPRPRGRIVPPAEGAWEMCPPKPQAAAFDSAVARERAAQARDMAGSYAAKQVRMDYPPPAFTYGPHGGQISDDGIPPEWYIPSTPVVIRGEAVCGPDGNCVVGATESNGHDHYDVNAADATPDSPGVIQFTTTPDHDPLIGEW